MNSQKELTHGELGSVTGRVDDVRTHPDSAATTAVEVETDDGVLGWVLFAPDADGSNYDWKSGRRYRFGDVVGCDLRRALQTREERVAEAFDTLDLDVLPDDPDPTQCPGCGGEIAVRDALELGSEIRERLDAITGHVLGVVTASQSVEVTETEIDDWQSQSDQGNQSETPTESPSVVCLDCGADVSAHYEQRAQERHGVQWRENRGRILENVSEGSLDTDASTGGQSDVAESAAPSSADVGMATGGGKDATGFRDNVREGYVPEPDALTYEGLFYDYYFDTGDTSDTAGGDSLFYPSYATAVTDAPLTGDTEQYVTVGLNSNLTEADLERKPLNLVAAVDISGSMSSQFDQYYYDEHGNRETASADTDESTKMAAARQALVALTEQLREEDRLGVVLYNSAAEVAKPLRRVGETNMDAIRGHIRDINAGGGTDMSAGFSAAVDLLEPHREADLTEVENRVIFMTDAMPNQGQTSRENIVDEFETAATAGIHTTFVGIGLDTNADLVESISGVRGANHYFVHSTAEFERRLSEEFTYMVTPLVFNLSLEVVSDGYELETVYGSPNADRATGEVMHVTTLFPSPTTDGETRGGVTLLQLEQTAPDPSVELVAKWTQRDGRRNSHTAEISLSPQTVGQFDNSGIRKAVLLARYGRLLRDWAADTHAGETGDGVDDWNHSDKTVADGWKRQSASLSVSQSYLEAFGTMRGYVADEMTEIGDETLSQELELLGLLAAQDPAR
jgi:Ca-activated chloride channel family protein